MLSNYLSIEEYTGLLKYVAKHHGFCAAKPRSPRIKYVRCAFDTRTNAIYSVSLDDQNFAVVNENRKRQLKNWIYSYLKGEDDGFDPVRDDPEIDWSTLLKDRQ